MSFFEDIYGHDASLDVLLGKRLSLLDLETCQSSARRMSA